MVSSSQLLAHTTLACGKMEGEKMRTCSVREVAGGWTVCYFVNKIWYSVYMYRVATVNWI